MRRNNRRFERIVTILLLLAFLLVTIYNLRLCRQIDAATRAAQADPPTGGSVFALPGDDGEWFVYSPEAGAFVPKYIDWEED